MEKNRQASFRIALASFVLSAGLLLVGWYDYTSTRNELLTLLVDQAASMRQAVAAAASLGEAASAQTQAAMAARLLDNGRLLRMLDARGGLTQVQLDEVARANRLFRITVLSATGERELSSGIGGPPAGSGRGFGPGGGGSGGGLAQTRGSRDGLAHRRRLVHQQRQQLVARAGEVVPPDGRQAGQQHEARGGNAERRLAFLVHWRQRTCSRGRIHGSSCWIQRPVAGATTIQQGGRPFPPGGLCYSSPVPIYCEGGFSPVHLLKNA